jgi:hypothetical protein
MGQLEVKEVRLAGPPRSRVRGFCIDGPAAGPQADSVLRISGWVAQNEVKITGTVVYCQGTILRSTSLNVARADGAALHPGTPENCGFDLLVTAMELPAEFELVVVAICEDHGQFPLALVYGRNAVSVTPSGGSKSLQPLMVTSLGRSGTTYLMRLLSQHAKVVVDRTYPYEANAARYFMHTARALTHPPAPGKPTRPFDLGDFAEPPLVEAPVRTTPAMKQFLATGYPGIAAEFACQATDAFYRQLAQGYGQSNATYFCEKVLPSGIRFMLWNLYAQPREIFLVRDFRDVACSVFAFNAKRGTLSFGRAEAESDEAYVQQLRQAARNMLETYRGCATKGLLVRYEDLVHRPVHTLREVLTYLNLDADSSVIEQLLRDASADDPQLEKHKTSSSAEASIGRWRHDLSPVLLDLCKKSFTDMLPSFGYKLDKQGGLVIEQSELVGK